MSCCGNKRKLWGQLHNQTSGPVQTQPQHQPQSHSQVEQNSPTSAVSLEAVENDPSQLPKIFEYTGNASLFVVGAVTRQQYRFVQRGEKREVAYEDSFGLMGERELRLVTLADSKSPERVMGDAPSRA